MGEAIEAGAEQIVGLVILPLGGALGWLALQFSPEGDAEAAAAHDTLAHDLLNYGASFAQSHPVYYLAVDLGGLLIIALVVLYEADLFRSYQASKIRAAGYSKLGEEGAGGDSANGGAGGGGGAGAPRAKPMLQRSVTGLHRDLRRAQDMSEELELKLRVAEATEDDGDGAEASAGGAGAANTPMRLKSQQMTAEMTAQLQEQQARKEQLQSALSNVATAASPDQVKRKTRLQASCASRLMGSTFMLVLRRALNGVVTVWLYFADIISDIEVAYLLYTAGVGGWTPGFYFAYLAGFLLFAQFIAVYARVMPYLESTFGKSTSAYQAFAWLGLPFGMLALDMLMFLEPFGLLAIAPLPDMMRTFIPAYKATRIIAEVMIESLPQCLLQSYILVTVMHHVHDHTATGGERGLLNMAIDGATFGEILPRSIAISTLTMLKTWIELVHSAREAGISVRDKIGQLWNVGHGLPLDALKKGTITTWSCQYSLSDGEVKQLYDALIKNSSLVRLNLAKAGLDWTFGPDADEKRSAQPLIDALAASPTALAGVQRLIVIEDVSGGAGGSAPFEVPVELLRRGGEAARAALREGGAFLDVRASGPRREEILLMSDLLRKNRRVTSAAADDIAGSEKVVGSILAAAARGELNREAWEEKISTLLVGGETRRAHFKSLLDADVLRHVGFTARQLLDATYSPAELYHGKFRAAELRKAVPMDAPALKTLGYVPKELRDAGFDAYTLRTECSYAASELRGGGFGALSLREAGFELVELKSAGFSLAELKEAAYGVSELRGGGFGADEMRKAKLFTSSEMRDGGYTAAELKAGGYSAKQAYGAGYECPEAAAAGWKLEQLKDAGYNAKELRKAGFNATAMRAVGMHLDDLRWAGYKPSELQEAGFNAADLKESGTSLNQLKAANTPVATLREAQYKADRLRQEGYGAGELCAGGYTCKEMKVGGWTTKELRKGNVTYSAEALSGAGYTPAELREGGYTSSELRAKGFTCSELSKGEYTCAELHEAGFPLTDIKAAGHSAKELRAVGLPASKLAEAGFKPSALRAGGFGAAELKDAGFSAVDLKDAGYSSSELVAIGYGVSDLKSIGFGVAEMREAGYRVKELAGFGFSPKELVAGGFGAREAAALDGRTTAELRQAEAPYGAGELRAIGFSASELRTGGYKALQLKEEGYSAEELAEGGYKPRTVEAVDGRSTSVLRGKGFTSKELRGYGFGLADLKLGGYPPKELHALEYTPEQLRRVGFSVKELRGGGLTAKQLFHEAGFSLSELREGGFPWKELVIFLRATHAELTAAGFEGLDAKDMIFKQYRPEAA